MTDDMWRRGSNSDDNDQGSDSPEDDFADFGELRFAQDETESSPLSFGDSDAGQRPHWTEPATSELPRLFPEDRSGAVSRPVARPLNFDDTSEAEEIDVWGSYSGSAPRPIPDTPAAGDRPSPDDTSGARRRVRLGDSPAGSAARSIPPIPREDSAQTLRTGRISISTDDTQDRPVTSSRPRPAGERGPRQAAPQTARAQRGSRTVPARRGVGGRDMPTATAVGLLLVAVFIAALMWKPIAVLAIVVLICGIAAVEFFDKVREKGYSPALAVGITACVCAPLGTYWVGETALPVVLTLAFMATAATFVGASGIESKPVPNMAITCLGMLWIGMMGSFAALIAGVSNVPGLSNVGTDTLFIVVVGVVANDVGALFVGSAAGKTPLRAWISPNKTVEGLMGGTLATLVTMWVVSLQSDTWNGIGEVLLLAIVVAVFAPFGDLVESMFKRQLGTKDFGTVIRGHGGVLDRFDGYLFVLPAAYYLLIVLQPNLS